MNDLTVPRASRPEGRGVDPVMFPEVEPQRTFGEFLAALAPYAPYIIGLALVLALGGFVMAARQPKQYQATAKLLVKTKSDLDAGTRATELANLIALLQGTTLQRAAHHELNLDQPPTSVPFNVFQSGVVVRQIPATNVIVVQVTLPDPTRAAVAANLICTRGSDESRRLNQQEALSTRDILTAQADGAMQRLQDAERNLNDFSRTSQLEVLQNDVDATLQQRSQLLALQVARAGTEAKLAAAERELQRQPKINTLSRSLDRDPALSQAATQVAPNASLVGLSVKGEEINVVARDLEQTVAETRVDLAGLLRQERELLRTLKVGLPALGPVAELHAQQLRQARLQAEYTIAKKVYEDTKLLSQQASLDIANRSSTLQMFDPSFPPMAPVGPHPLRTAVLGLLSGLAVGSAAATAAVSLRDAQRRAAHTA